VVADRKRLVPEAAGALLGDPHERLSELESLQARIVPLGEIPTEDHPDGHVVAGQGSLDERSGEEDLLQSSNVPSSSTAVASIIVTIVMETPQAGPSLRLQSPAT
jgi:hypothetical protein